MAKKKKPRAPGSSEAPAQAATPSGGLASAIKTVQWLSSIGHAKNDEGAQVFRSLKPLILVRAAKYELDAAAAKSEHAAGLARHIGSKEKASPAFRITSMLSSRARWHEALRLLRDLRQQPSDRRPKLGAYQRWVRELDVAEGDAQELLMLDAVMRLAAGFGAAVSGAAPASGRLEAFAPLAPAAQRIDRTMAASHWSDRSYGSYG
eukprot:Skav203493  [mRNA]  locus=scaffold3956:125785:130909:+ [translate_table: standard]